MHATFFNNTIVTLGAECWQSRGVDIRGLHFIEANATTSKPQSLLSPWTEHRKNWSVASYYHWLHGVCNECLEIGTLTTLKYCVITHFIFLKLVDSWCIEPGVIGFHVATIKAADIITKIKRICWSSWNWKSYLKKGVGEV